jgi:hypothetical protein
VSPTTALKANHFVGLLGNDVCDPNASEDKLKEMAKLNDAKSSAYVSRLQSGTNFNRTEFGVHCKVICHLK